ncbi:hypothetical protein AB0N65_14895 [Paenarthrobacter sp. NPDC089322]|uniref:hypothetical protein n=1 Tax=Paenarthrobacter sp. NPDC089322 TaxID=3155065 RepID=UPI00342A2C80
MQELPDPRPTDTSLEQLARTSPILAGKLARLSPDQFAMVMGREPAFSRPVGEATTNPGS